MASGGWPPYGRSMRSQARRLLPLALLVGLMASLTPASVVAAPSESQLLEAEAVTLDKINDERADRGLVALRGWGRSPTSRANAPSTWPNTICSATRTPAVWRSGT